MKNQDLKINENNNTKKIARVTIIGQQNVGKSALFNKIASRVRALVYDEKGVTRDILKDTCEWKDSVFEIIDTAGLSFKKNIKDDYILDKSIQIVKDILNTTDLFVFLIDGSVGFTNEDRKIFSYIQKTNSPYILTVNKSDKKDVIENFKDSFGSEFNDVIFLSAIHNRGVEDLLNKIVEEINKLKNLKNEIDLVDTRIRVSFLGRPNVGKSSLLNALLKKERSIVSNIPGTTRETIEEIIKTENFSFTIYDTAGVKKKRTVKERLEELMISNTINSIERSHIVIMVLDISEEDLFDQDIQLAMHSFYDLYRAVLIVWNKIDISESDIKKKIKNLTEKHIHFFSVVPQIFVSAKTGKNIDKIIPEIESLSRRYFQNLEKSLIKNILQSEITKKILVRNEQRLKVNEIEILRFGPPTIKVKTNLPAFFKESQLAFLTKILRNNYDLLGVPIKWIVE